MARTTTAADDSATRNRGRPAGGGNNAQQAQSQILDAAERLFVRQGFATSTMEAIGREAGYSRAVMYRHFRNRDALLDSLVVRVMMTEISNMMVRLVVLHDLAEMLTESLVIVATEVAKNPLLQVLSERADGSSLASLIVDAPNLVDVLKSMYEGVFAGRADVMRPGLPPADAARYVLGTALSLLLGVIPNTDDPKQVRRYVRTFVLPALVAAPPEPEEVFT